MTTEPITTPTPRRRWLQFSLRTLLVLFGSPVFVGQASSAVWPVVACAADTAGGMALAQAIRVGLRDSNGAKVEVSQAGNLAQQRDVRIIEGPPASVPSLMVGIYPGLVERLSGGAEYVERFDRDLDTTHVLVDYTFYPSTPHPYFAQAFEGYTGLRLKAINLFDGDLQTEIELPR